MLLKMSCITVMTLFANTLFSEHFLEEYDIYIYKIWKSKFTKGANKEVCKFLQIVGKVQVIHSNSFLLKCQKCKICLSIRFPVMRI